MHFPGDAASIPNRSPVPQLAVEFGRVLLVAVIAVDVSVVTVSAETGVARAFVAARNLFSSRDLEAKEKAEEQYQHHKGHRETKDPSHEQLNPTWEALHFEVLCGRDRAARR